MLNTIKVSEYNENDDSFFPNFIIGQKRIQDPVKYL